MPDRRLSASNGHCGQVVRVRNATELDFMNHISNTPKPPYYAVIFTSCKSNNDRGYAQAAERMLKLAEQQEGFLGVESAREALGITVSYWSSLPAIKAWKANAEHQQAQSQGRDIWYSEFKVRIAKVERDYGKVSG